MLIDDYAPVQIDLEDHMPVHLIPGEKPHATNVPSVSYAVHTLHKHGFHNWNASEGHINTFSPLG